MTDGVAVARSRQGLYRFFGGALIAPDEERLASLVAAIDLLDGMGLESYAFHGQWRQLANAIHELGAIHSLEAEYVRLFASGVDVSFCPPTESYYRAEAKGGGMADLVARLENEYRALGFTSVEGAEEPDHVVTELEVMSALCGREASAWALGNASEAVAALADQDGFLRGHLAVWFPALRQRVQQARPVPFYATLVEAAHAYVVHDVDLVRVMRRELEVVA